MTALAVFLTATATFAVALFLAFLVESMVEFVFGAIADHVEALKPFRWLLMYIALGVGIGLAFHYQLDLVATLIRIVSGVEAAPDPFGMTLSGMAIGRGANYVHQLVSTYFPKPAG